ncbi:MAG: hypothetical protein AAGE85_09100 [Pseudomonadota bacterium]
MNIVDTSLKVLAFGLLAMSPPAVAQTTAWTSDPVVSGEGCENLEYGEMAQFLDTYLAGSQTYAGSEKESGAQMLLNYTIASALVLRSQVCLAEALELKEIADDLKQQQAVLTSGTSLSKRQVKKQRKLTEQANAEIEATARELEELTPEQRERFGKGTAAYLFGTYATGQIFRSVDEYVVESAAEVQQDAKPKKSRFGGIPGLNQVSDAAQGAASVFRKATDVGVVFGGLKDHTVSLYETSRFLREYSEQNEIDLPDDATDRLAEVSDWV